jgi:aconitate hydratase
MGILPCQFMNGETPQSLGLTGKETYEIEGVASLTPRKTLTVRAKSDDETEKKFSVLARVDTPEEILYYQNGGILQYVLRQMV